MYCEKKILAIVPARSGSKGLPGKNVKELLGKPLIAWSIEAGLNCSFIDEVAVSTDCPKIAEIAKIYGAKVPFLRPPELASDTASSFDVIKHVVEYYQDELNQRFDFIVLLEPTSPLRDSLDIESAIVQLFESSASAIVGICKTESQNPAFLVKKKNNQFICGYEDNAVGSLRRQDIMDVYFLEGSIYISEIAELMRKKSFYHDKTIGFVVPKWKSFEIDDMDDFIIVEALAKDRCVKTAK